MAGVQRTASIVWTGDLKRGGGGVSLDTSGAAEGLGINVPARAGEPNGGTSPEELLAASHAGCYAMALAAELTQAGNPPERLETRATCFQSQEGGGFKVAAMELNVRGKVEGLDDDGFRQAAKAAERDCPISNALRGNVEISVDAALVD